MSENRETEHPEEERLQKRIEESLPMAKAVSLSMVAASLGSNNKETTSSLDKRLGSVCGRARRWSCWAKDVILHPRRFLKTQAKATTTVSRLGKPEVPGPKVSRTSVHATFPARCMLWGRQRCLDQRIKALWTCNFPAQCML